MNGNCLETNEPDPAGDSKSQIEGAQLLAAIVESSDNAIISKNLNGIVMSWNRSAQRIFGYTAQEMIGQHISVLIPPDLMTEEDQILERIIRGEPIQHFESRRACKDGTAVAVSVSMSAVRNSEGRIVGLSTIARDITQRKIIDQKLRLLVGALEAAANGIVITDRKGVIIWVNKAFERLTGYSATEVIGLTPRVLKSGKHDNSFYSEMWKTIAQGDVWRGEVVNQRKDGSFYTEDMMVTPMPDASGTVTHFVAIKQDATERIKAAAEREELIASLKKALSEVKTLTGLLPICATCKKIRDDSGYWNQVEVYVRHHTNANFTHGICPDCAKKMLDDIQRGWPRGTE